MLKYTTAAISALAVVGFAGSAMATSLAQTGQVDNKTYGVPVNITVEQEVSVWAGNGELTNPPPINLDMNGADANNSATAESTVTYITNVDANVHAQVDGTLPTPIVPGGGINFFLFPNVNSGDALTAIGNNAYTPAGALVWTNSTLGTDQLLIPTTGVNTSAHTATLTYASDAPGELPLPTTYNLTVTYTIAAN